MSNRFLTKNKAYNLFLFLSLIVFFLAAPPSGYGYPLYPKPPKVITGHAKGSPVRSDIKKQIPVSKKESPVIPMPVYKKRLIKNIPGSVDAIHVSVEPGQTKTVYLSKQFINRIVFNHYVDYARTSKTGDVSITINGKDAVVVFSPYMIQSGLVKKVVYPKIPSSVLFKSGHEIISLLVVPKNIPPQTIYVNAVGSSGGIRPFHSNGGFSKYVAKIFKSIYADVAPKGYLPKTEVITYKSNYPQIKIKMIKEYKGARFTVYEYLIKNLSDKELSLSNKEFLYLRSGILAISLSEEHLFKNTYTRLLIMGR
ncbi:MAG: hypothetical protein ACYCSQ_00730 [bacterium]